MPKHQCPNCQKISFVLYGSHVNCACGHQAPVTVPGTTAPEGTPESRLNRLIVAQEAPSASDVLAALVADMDTMAKRHGKPSLAGVATVSEHTRRLLLQMVVESFADNDMGLLAKAYLTASRYEIAGGEDAHDQIMDCAQDIRERAEKIADYFEGAAMYFAGGE